MDKYEYVLAELNRRKGQLSKVAEKTNVGRRTIGHIMSLDFQPRMSTLDVLYEFLKENKRKDKL